MKLSNKNIAELSHYYVQIESTWKKLEAVLGQPQYSENEGHKNNVEWTCEMDDGELITIYDWKEGREIFTDENIYWNINGRSLGDTLNAKRIILELLAKDAIKHNEIIKCNKLKVAIKEFINKEYSDIIKENLAVDVDTSACIEKINWRMVALIKQLYDEGLDMINYYNSKRIK